MVDAIARVAPQKETPSINNLSIRRFWGKRGKVKAKKGDSSKRETPDTDAFNEALHLHVSKRSPKINLTLRSDNLVPRVLSYPSYGARERPGSLSLLLRRAGRREPWERG